MMNSISCVFSKLEMEQINLSAIAQLLSWKLHTARSKMNKKGVVQQTRAIFLVGRNLLLECHFKMALLIAMAFVKIRKLEFSENYNC